MPKALPSRCTTPAPYPRARRDSSRRLALRGPRSGGLPTRRPLLRGLVLRGLLGAWVAGALLPACGGPERQDHSWRSQPGPEQTVKDVPLPEELGLPPPEPPPEPGPEDPPPAELPDDPAPGDDAPPPDGRADDLAPGSDPVSGDDTRSVPPGAEAGTDEQGGVASVWEDVPVPEAFQQPRPPVAPREDLVHVRVRDTASRFRPAETVTIGAPFARGVLGDPAELRAWDGRDQKPLPCQARTLSRWPDGSVRWALVDTSTDVQTRGEVRVAVGRAPDIEADADPFTLQSTDTREIVDDGRTRWSVLETGSRGDAVLGLRARLLDRFGHEYRFFADRDSLTLLETGPLRRTYRLRGAHRKVSDEGLEIDFHTATVRVHLLAGTGTARLEWTLENGPLEDPPGRLAFRSYELLLDGPAGARTVVAPVRELPGDASVSLKQPSARLTRLLVDGESQSIGEPGDLWMGVLGEETDVWVHMVESAGNHPSALDWLPGRPLRVGLLPPSGKRDHFLDDATRKTFRLTLGRDLGEGGADRMASVARPVHAALEPEEVLLSRAWGDFGVFHLPSQGEMARAPSLAPIEPTGWADFGEWVKNTHQSGSPRNRLSVFLEAMQSGSADLFRRNLVRAWHAMDLRPYHIQGFDADEFPRANLYEGVPHPNEKPERRLGRTGIDQRFPEYKRDLPAAGHGYNGFDPEHMALDDVYECYLLTGSWVALEALEHAGEAMLTWKELVPDGGIHSSRTFGWTLRALMQVWRATGDERILEGAERYVARADMGRGRERVRYLVSQRPDARHIATARWDSPWMVAVALNGLAAYWDETSDPRVPPMATDLADFCMLAYRGRKGFLSDLAVDELPSPVDFPSSPMGVSTWVPSGLAAAAYITGDHGPLERVAPYIAAVIAREDEPMRFASKDWHWWQAPMAMLVTRHGPRVLVNPEAVLPRR